MHSTKSIVFTGFVHQTKLYQYYNIADVAVMPSMFEDPAPLVCIETQATGTPLIATRVGGISEYADKVGVVLVERDDKLVTNLAKEVQRLLDNPDLCVKMGEANRKNALQYGTEGYFSRFCKIVNSLLSEFGLTDRTATVETIENVLSKDIDYTRVNKIIEEKKERSQNYLLSAVED